jgi:tetratricopeptide (TPR) repeat protein
MSTPDANLSKAEMLKQARERLADKKPEGNTFKVENLAGQTVVYTQQGIPDKPIMHFQANTGCNFTLGEGCSIVKLELEGCKDCVITLPAGTRITTSIIEIWNCDNVTVNTDVAIGTCQVDISQSLAIHYGALSQLGQLVQAGVERLEVKFGDAPGQDFVSGLVEIKKTICPDLQADHEKTTQFTTRLVDGEVLTEEIIRLSNDFPTTVREKAKHDRDIKAKEAALTAMAEYRKTLGTEQFKIKEYQQAAVHYTESIQIVATNPSVWANRAMCWLKLANPTKALADAEKCLELDPKYTKAHFRRGVALLELDRFVDACKAFRTTLDLDPKNAQAKSSMMLAEKKLSMLNR